MTAALILTGSLLPGREWTIDGKNKVEAEFGGIISNTVFLKKPDGSQIKRPLTSLSADDQAYIKEQERKTASVVATSKAPPAAPHKNATASPIVRLFDGKLVALGQGQFVDYALPNPSLDYVVLYFSAGWCQPCHRFTPKLVEFYNRMKPQHGNFEVVFVSFDHNERAMLYYMHDFSMPWPALKFSEIKASTAITKFAGPGIPCLAVLDAKGNVIAHSYINGRYVGAEAPMDYLGRLLERRR